MKLNIWDIDVLSFLLCSAIAFVITNNNYAKFIFDKKLIAKEAN